ncbi:MAG: PAS domain S-box protein [Phycisphaerales bacterium]|nr:PAS domain S-box protein [Phycisphaerales bacterium]MCB9855238.1 PAS domain S-box protein [Phycisphaerales bacterium]MCB9862831.1 PAS domain S-box protein [Phycisphaerales bacterium]
MSLEHSIENLDTDAAMAMQTAISVLMVAQKKLIHSERRHRATIQNAVDAIITIDEDGVIEAANPAVERVFGYTVSELIGRNVALLVPGEHHENHDHYLKRYLETFEARIIGIGRDVEGRRKDGSLIPIHLSIGHFELDGRNYFTGIIQDLTDRRKYEASMRRLGAIVESSNDAIIGKTLEGTITDWNKAAEELYGYSASEIIGRSVATIVPKDRLDELTDILIRIGRGEPVSHIETKRVRKSGEFLDVSLNVSPICDGNGNVIGASASARDISAQKAAEQLLLERSDRIQTMNVQLEEANERLEMARFAAEAADVAKSDFLANMSHEIRTPLTAILGFVDLIGEAAELNDDSVQMVDTIRRNGRHLLDIINDILDISKIESGKMKTERLRFSPIDVIGDVIDLMTSRATAGGLYLNFERTTSLPETIESDPTRFRQILTNLVGNALKFTIQGGVRVIVGLSTIANEPQLDIAVRDTGIGISGDPDRLFEPFQQGESGTSRKFGGTGLGLSICKKLAEHLGGGVSATGKAGDGSEFRVWIPTGPLYGIPLISPESCIRRPAASRVREAVTLPPCRILLVEDGIDNQRLIARVLTSAGAIVETEDNGLLAVERLTAASGHVTPDIVIMDMQMPVMDGYEATRTLRASGFDRPIIALTANAMIEDRTRCLDAGCSDYAVKPLDRDGLIEVIRRQLNASRPATAATP